MSVLMVILFLFPIVSIVWFAFHIAHQSQQYDAMGVGARRRVSNADSTNNAFFGGCDGSDGGGGCGDGGGGGCS